MNFTFATLLLAAVLAATPALAEKADRDKPTQIDADAWRGDELKQVVVYSGNVVLIKGTMRMTGERLELREDPEGYQYAVMTAKTGGVATFRQRRDPTRPGIEEYVEAQAERLEYDGRNETIRLNGRAQVRRLENAESRDEFSGGLITYSLRDSKFSGEGADAARDGSRTRTIIAPRARDAPAAAPTPLKTERNPPAERKS